MPVWVYDNDLDGLFGSVAPVLLCFYFSLLCLISDVFSLGKLASPFFLQSLDNLFRPSWANRKMKKVDPSKDSERSSFVFGLYWNLVLNAPCIQSPNKQMKGYNHFNFGFIPVWTHNPRLDSSLLMLVSASNVSWAGSLIGYLECKLFGNKELSGFAYESL